MKLNSTEFSIKPQFFDNHQNLMVRHPVHTDYFHN